MKRIVLPVGLLLATLAAAPFSSASEGGQPKTIKSIWINPFMIMRLNNHINMVSNVTFSDGQLVQRWTAVDCTQRQGYRLYWDMLDSEGQTGHRFYGDSLAHYAPPQPSHETTPEQIAQLCGSKLKETDWVYVEKKNSWDTPTLLDRANIVRIGDNLIVKIGYGYDKISWDPPYDAPFDLKIEQHLYNCTSRVDKVIGALDVDPQGYVTDSLIDKQVIRRASSFESTPATLNAFNKICQLQDGDDFSGLGRYVSKKDKKADEVLGPMMPQFDDNQTQWLDRFPLDAAVMQKAQTLVKGWAMPKFQRLSWTETSSTGDKVSYRMDARADGLVVRLDDYRLFKAQRIMVANSIQMQSALSISALPNQTQTLETTLRFPLYQGQRYVTTVKNSELDEKKKINTLIESCIVEDKEDAHTLNPAFRGSYWRIRCEQRGGDDNVTTVSAFLTDLNIFLPLERSDKGKNQRYTLSEVTLRR